MDVFFLLTNIKSTLIAASDTVYVKEEVEEKVGVDKLNSNCQSKLKKIFQLLR